MNKEEYLQKLEQHLKKYLSKEEIKDILMDYGEYFEDGRRQNKTDIEISAKLGDPEVIASQFIEEIKEEKRKKHEEDFEKIKETTSSVVKNIKKTTNDFAQSAKEKINSDAVGENIQKAKTEGKGFLTSVIDFIKTVIKAALFIIVCILCVMAVLALLSLLGGIVLFCLGGGIGGITLCSAIAGFVSGAITAAGIFASIFLIAGGVLFAVLFIIVVYIVIKYLKDGFKILFAKREG